MHHDAAKRLLFPTLLLIAFLAPRAGSSADVIHTDEIRPGMKGYGLTVFEGTRPERFDVEVISVVPNFLLRQNIILIRCSHPITDKAGVIGGMSGSPIYIEGRLAGALAYGWPFSKEPVAGVTSIDDMLAVLKRAPRGAALNRLARAARVVGVPFPGGEAEAPAPDHYFGLFKRGEAGGIAPADTPLTLGGFLGPARDILADALGRFGLVPIAGGGAGGGEYEPRSFEPGGALGVQLIRGDMSATAIGTVTAIEGKNVLAFGHPMFNMGEGYLPVTTARIHTVVASIARSNKLGSPVQVAGSLVQDRNACIVARSDQQAVMIPVEVNVRDSRSRTAEKYRVEIALHRLLTPRFLRAALVNIIVHAASDAEDVTAEVTGTIQISGRAAPVTVYDSGASRFGLASLAGFFRPIALADQVLDNPFEDAAITSMRFDINLRYGLDIAEIAGVYLDAEEPSPGETVNLHVRLQRYNAAEQEMTVRVPIPLTAAGKKLLVEVAGGDFVTPPMPEPQSLDDLIANFDRYYPAESLVVGLNIPGEGVSIRGRVLDHLPASAIEALQPAAGQEPLSRYATALRQVTETPFLVVGKAMIPVSVGGVKNR